VELSKRLLGAEHPYTLKIMDNLVTTYHKQGKTNEAKALNNGIKGIRNSKKKM